MDLDVFLRIPEQIVKSHSLTPVIPACRCRGRCVTSREIIVSGESTFGPGSLLVIANCATVTLCHSMKLFQGDAFNLTDTFLTDAQLFG